MPPPSACALVHGVAQEKETERLVAEFEKQGIKVWLLDQCSSAS